MTGKPGGGPPQGVAPGEREPVDTGRREFFRTAGLAVASPLGLLTGGAGAAAADGTPEQIHLTFGEDPSTCVQVSWASPAQALNPRVEVTHRTGVNTIAAIQRTYTDGLNGQTVFTYHATLDGLEPDAVAHYRVTADNDRHRARAVRRQLPHRAPRPGVVPVHGQLR